MHKEWQGHTGEVLDSKNNFEVIECKKCQFKHVVPIPTEEELVKVYEDEFYSDENTQTEAINSTNVRLNTNMTKLDEQPVTETALSFAIITNTQYANMCNYDSSSNSVSCLDDDCGGYYDCNCVCNGTAEEQTIYYDHDGDGLGGERSKQHCNANALPDGYVLNSDDDFDYLEETECDIYSTLNIPFEEFQIENEALIFNLFGYEYSIDISNCITVTQCPNDEDIWQSYNGGVFTNLNKIVHLPEIKVLLINENEYSADFLMNYSEILFSMPTN